MARRIAEITQGNFREICELCHEADEPLFVPVGGGELVVMSGEDFYRELGEANYVRLVEKGLKSIAEGRTVSAKVAFKRFEEKYGI